MLTAGEQALAVRTPTPDDELLGAELARLDRKLDATDAERRRLIDLYQAGLLELPELQRRATEVEHRRHDLALRRDALTTQRQELTRDNQLRRRVRDFATRVLDVIDTLDFDQKQTLLRLVVDDVHVTGWHVQIRLRIYLDDGPDGQSRPPNPDPGPDRPGPVSTQDRLRSLGSHRRRVLPHARSPNPTTRRPHQQLINPRGADIHLATSGTTTWPLTQEELVGGLVLRRAAVQPMRGCLDVQETGDVEDASAQQPAERLVGKAERPAAARSRLSASSHASTDLIESAAALSVDRRSAARRLTPCCLSYGS